MNRFKECREKAGLSQKYVAVALGIKPPSVCDWEKGRTMPSPENLAQVAELYHVSVDYLLGREETEDAATDENNTARSQKRAEAHEILEQLSDENYQAMLTLLRSMTEGKK